MIARDGYRCRICGKGVEDNVVLRVHHALYWKGRHGNQMDELITCCSNCHTPANHKKGSKLYGYAPQPMKSYAGAAVMNQIRWKILDQAKAIAPEVFIRTTYGANTKGIANSIGKSMGLDGGLSLNASHTSMRSTTESDTTSDTTSHSETETTSETTTTGTTNTTGKGRTLQIENINKPIVEMLERIGEQLKRVQEGEDYGAYSCGAYFLSSKPESSLLAANTYRALMIGEGSSVESGAINSWTDLNGSRI